MTKIATCGNLICSPVLDKNLNVKNKFVKYMDIECLGIFRRMATMMVIDQKRY